MLNEFVEKILVHERARKGSQDTTQEVEIYFNFVGRYIPPSLQPVPLTPEEQEELRKKEERKDRLHQNYLSRKANGKQKEWEERYNANRKAQVEEILYSELILENWITKMWKHWRNQMDYNFIGCVNIFAEIRNSYVPLDNPIFSGIIKTVFLIQCF